MAYNKITLFNNVKYNYLLVKNKAPTQADIDLISGIRSIASGQQPTFDPQPNTNYIWIDSEDWDDSYYWTENISNLPIIEGLIIDCQFNNTILSSIISGLIDPVISWLLYRKNNNTGEIKKIAILPYEQIIAYDYGTSNSGIYSYILIPQTEKELGIGLESKPIEINFFNYTVVGIQEISTNEYRPTQIWKFDSNLTSTDMTQNTDVTIFNNFTQYPKVSKGDRNYQTLGITALLGGIKLKGYEYIEPKELLIKWQEFVASNNLCVLKDRKGNVKVGKITENPTSKYIDEVGKQPTYITFNFVEVDNIKNISVYGTEDKIYNELEN